MKRTWKLIYYSILSSGPMISKKITNKLFQKGSHINNTFLKGGFYISKCQGKESLSYRIYHTVSHLSNIRLNFQLYLISSVCFLLHVATKSANSTFSLVRWWDVACSLFDTWPHILRGVLLKLLTFRISIIHRYRIQFHN